MSSAGANISKPATEQANLISMLKAAQLPHMIVQDMHDPDQCTVTVENLILDRDTRVDVVWQFRNHHLDRVWVREG